jgi:hypothetical protein
MFAQISYTKKFQILDMNQSMMTQIFPASSPTRHIPQRHSRPRVCLLRTKLRMLITLSHPLLLFPLLSTSGPPPSNPSHARVEYSHSQDDDDIPRIVRRVIRKIETKPAIDQAKEKNRRTEEFVYLGEFRDLVCFQVR